MKEIHIADVILEKRRKQKVTQEELAAFIGVSKASVSKWETAQSYPDITFLPKLASYFNITVDELMGYKPQMTDAEIRTTYLLLCDEFAKGSFDEAMQQCQGIIKKYYSCYPLLFYMGILLINYGVSVKTPRKENMLQEARTLFERVHSESEDADICKQALHGMTMCHLLLNQPEEVVELLGDGQECLISKSNVLSMAYQMQGNHEKAKEVLQIELYQYLIGMMGDLPGYLLLYVQEPKQFVKITERFLRTADLFDLDHLHPGIILPVYLAAAEGYTLLKKQKEALKMLERYVRIGKRLGAPELHGDDFFDRLEPWLDRMVLGASAPRDAETIRKSMVDGIEKNPVFDTLTDQQKLKKLLEELKNVIHVKGDYI